MVARSVAVLLVAPLLAAATPVTRDKFPCAPHDGVLLTDDEAMSAAQVVVDERECRVDLSRALVAAQVQDAQPAMPWWGWVSVGAAFAAGVAVGVYTRK